MAITNELKNAVQAMQKGDPQGFAKVYEETHDFVYSKAMYIMKSEQDACDLTQETYIQAYRGIISLEDVNNVYAWLGGIVYRQGMRMFGKNKEVLTGEEEDYIFDEIVSTEATPEQTVEENATVEIVKGLIDELPELQRVAVMAFYYDNMKIDEIAEMCGCSSNTIKSRLNYAKKYLKEKVEENERQNRYKLCSVSPLILLLVFKRLFAEKKYKMSAYTTQTVYAATCEGIGIKALTLSITEGANAAKTAADSASISGNVVNNVAMAKTVVTAAETVKKVSLGVKIGATIAALAVAGGIGAAVIHNINSDNAEGDNGAGRPKNEVVISTDSNEIASQQQTNEMVTEGSIKDETEEASENTAEDEFWELDEATGVLTVYKGFDEDYTKNVDDSLPWSIDSSIITKIVVAEGIETIGSGWFKNLINVETVEFPSTLKEIGSNAFYYCGATKIEIPEGVEKIGIGAFSYMKRLTEISFPSTLKVIPGSCCQYDKALTVVHFPEGLEEIETGAFSDSPILELRFPDTVTNVNNYAFDEEAIGTYYGKKDSIAYRMAKRSFRPFVEE